MTHRGVPLDFEPWYRAEYPRLVNAVGLVIGDHALAADAAAEAFTRALAKWRRVSRMEQPTGWVYRVALNDAKRRLRRSAHERRLLAERALTMPATTPPIEGDQELWDAVARLSEQARTVVVLRYVADMTEPAIAQVLGVKRGTVATTLRRAHQRLAAELGPAGHVGLPGPPSPSPIEHPKEFHHAESY